MLHKVGLLPAGNFQQVPFAYKMYQRADNIGWEQSNAFKRAFSVDVSIEFIGVWLVLNTLSISNLLLTRPIRDTVDSVGIIPKRLPFTTSNTIVRTFRHAVALDERRAKFKANLWNRPNAEETRLGRESPIPRPIRQTSFDEPPNPSMTQLKSGKTPSNAAVERSMRKEDEDDKKLNTLERLYSERGETMTDIEEVWFAVGVPLF